MAFLVRPHSLELEVNSRSGEEENLKQTEILEDLIGIAEGTPDNSPIEGFQRNEDGSFTVTLDSIVQKEKLARQIEQKKDLSHFTYTVSSADIVGGSATILGCPNEYPNFKLRAILSRYVDVAKIKDGKYKNFPRIRNGVKHFTYKKIYTALPRFLYLPEQIQVKIKTNEEMKCFRCGGPHFARNVQGHSSFFFFFFLIYVPFWRASTL